MMGRVADILRRHRSGSLSRNQTIVALTLADVREPVRLIDSAPDPDAVGFNARVQPYIAKSPLLREYTTVLRRRTPGERGWPR